MVALMTNFGIQTKSVDPDQTAPRGVCNRDVLDGLADNAVDDIYPRLSIISRRV